MTPEGVSWGLMRGRHQRVIQVADRFARPEFSAGTPTLAVGNGRSYGDCCLNDDGILLGTRQLDRYLSFDPVEGTLTCEAGVLLSDVIALVLPRGWFLPVTPGTQFVTIGGAIANDVHGKNHHRAGAFGCHVEELGLLRSSGEVQTCSRAVNATMFHATVGGLGLTGLILWARIRLRRITHTEVEGEIATFGSIGEFLEWSALSDHQFEYTVAWIDCFSSGRGVLSRANHAEGSGDTAPAAADRKAPMRVPPIPIVGATFISAFNAVYFRWHQMRRGRRRWRLRPFLYPLDALQNWNRLYGSAGFFQHQSVIPAGPAEKTLHGMLARIRASQEGSMLTVLKMLGARASGGMMSFPRPGVTLAVDFANRGRSTRRLLQSLDAIVVEAGGALYPAKDAGMSPECFRASFPRLEEFQAYVDPAFSSSLWRRVTR